MPERRSAVLDRLRGHPEAWLLLVILALGAALSVAAPGFATLSNMVDLLESSAVQGILALGLFVVLVSGGIDISFAATASVSQYVAAWLAARAGWPAAAALGAGLLTGAALGAVNATLIHYARVTSIIATIASMSVYFALLMYVTGGRSIYDLPDWWTERVVFFQAETGGGDLVRVTLPIVAVALAALLTWLLMAHTAVGRQLTAMGGNPEAARRVGMPVAALHYAAYGFLGFMAALAGLLQAHRVGESVPNAMYGGELAVLSAAVLGGASLTGGVGTVPGVLCGVVLLAVLQNGLNLLGVTSYAFGIVIGVAILASTSLTVMSARARGARRKLGAEPARG